MVDSLEMIGVSRHFSSEIKSILDITFNSWLKRDDEIMLDVATCAMAFRMNGYDVSSDELSHVVEASSFNNSLEGYVDETKALLELYKASRVKYALKVPFYATLDRLDHRRNIEHFDAMAYQRPSQVNQDHLAFAVEDFTVSQLIYQNELLHLESWEKENRLDQLEFARMKLTYGYLSACATIFHPELSEARICWTKHCVLTTISDDFFDVAGSKEELENLLELIEKWDEHEKLQFYSERVKILFCAIYTTVNELGEKASVIQNHDVRKHLIELWLSTLRSMNTEAEWVRSQYVPTIDEYMTNANMSYALGPVVLAPLYFVGPELSESVVNDQECNELFRLMNTCCRLLNDIQGFEREGSQGKVNSVSLLVLYSGGSMSTAEAKTIEESIASCRRDLLRLVLKEDSVVPRPCKELFCKSLVLLSN